MDTASHVSVRSEQSFIKNAENFKKELLSRLKWNRKQWEAAGEANTKLNKLCNSLHFWKNKLKPAIEDVSIVITLFSQENDNRVELFDIIEAIEGINEKFKVVGIANFRNPRYVCLYFENKSIRDKVKEAFTMLNDKFVVYLSWALNVENDYIKLNVHWLPLTLNIEKIKDSLDKFVICMEEERKSLFFMSGREMPAARVEFKAALKKDITVESIPHLIEINNMEALVTISGRKPLCLNCDRLGHISKDCDLRFCNTCRVLKQKSHVCAEKTVIASYADVLKINSFIEENKDPDVLEAGSVVIGKELSSHEKQEISDKIRILENQLMSTSDATISMQDRLEKKRKADDSCLAADSTLESEEFSNDSGDEEKLLSEDGSESFIDDVEGEGESEEPLKDEQNKEKPENYEQSIKKGRKRNKKKKVVSHKSKDLVHFEEGKKETAEQKSNMVTRSYGKPLPKNKDKMLQEKKYNKIADIREFVFED